MKSLDFFFNFSLGSLNFWALVRPEYSPFLGIFQGVLKHGYTTHYSGIAQGVLEDAHHGKGLKFKRSKLPNTYTFVSFQGQSEVEKHCNL